MSGITPTTEKLIKTLPTRLKPIAKVVKLNEPEANLANIRMIQELAVSWAPNAIFSRSIADLSELTFLEATEKILVYYAPAILGENIFRKLFSKKLSPELKKVVSTPLEKMLSKDSKMDSDIIEKVKPVKAAIAMAGLIIPLAEYSLSYVKNIFTLKMFKQADFNNIANLNKNKKEDSEKQQKVKKSAVKHIKFAGVLAIASVAFAALITLKGKNSTLVNKISDYILIPGNKIFKKNDERAKAFNKYFSLDFDSTVDGKLKLSHGQITACVIAALFGYGGAAKDRGKQNFLEVMFRLPLVGFYAVTGSEMFEKGFVSIMKKKESYKGFFNGQNSVPKLSQLGDIAKTIAAKKGLYSDEAIQKEFNNLFKKKAVITSVPFIFSIGFMGMFVAGLSRFFTQYRYNKEMENRTVNPYFEHKNFLVNK